LEIQKEAAIAMAPIGIGLSEYTLEDVQELEILELPIPKIRPLSKKGEEEYPEIWKIHQASKLFTKTEAKEWINSYNVETSSVMPLKKHQLSTSRTMILDRYILPKKTELSNTLDLAETILRRGSTRRFTRTSIPISILYTILYNSTRGIPIDFLKVQKEDDLMPSLIDTYLISNDISGISSGGYYYDRKSNTLDLLKKNISREISGYLCLGQSLFSDASAVIFLMADLENILGTLGNRGYRAAQFEAGVVAGRIYLLSYAQEIGASGSTFFDDAVSEVFSPHAKDKSTMIAIGIGVPAYKSRPGKVFPDRLKKEQLLVENL
jgi:hypothetical protein